MIRMMTALVLVLGLVAFIFVAAIIVVLGLEVNVVLRRHLYPRCGEKFGKSAKWQATQWPGTNSRQSGILSAQRSCA